MPFPYFLIVEIICLAISAIYITNKKSGWWQNFVWFLALTVITEVSAYIIIATHQMKSNHWLHNIFLPIEFLFISWVLFKICCEYFNCKKLLLWGLAIFAIIYFIESIENSFTEYSFIANSFASVWIVIISCLYYYYLLKQDDYIDIAKHAPFWIITGCFFFYFGTTSCNIFF